MALASSLPAMKYMHSFIGGITSELAFSVHHSGCAVPRTDGTISALEIQRGSHVPCTLGFYLYGVTGAYVVILFRGLPVGLVAKTKFIETRFISVRAAAC